MTKSAVFALGLAAATALTTPAFADKLDDVIASGTLRCAVVLDFPPMGSRDENNNPIGFDVDYCNDLAKALGVTAEIVETPFPERIPALMSGRVDVGVASTSDTLMLFATGAAAADGQARVENADDSRLDAFRAALNDILKDLALQVVRDGEGARKMVAVTVTGAESDAAAKRIGLSIANSPLVKTAVAGEDANWGRIVMAVGKSGEMADRDRLAIWFGDVRVAVDGERDPAYSEEATTAIMKRQDIEVRVDIGLGEGQATVWTCDLTKEYVEINGDYRS